MNIESEKIHYRKANLADLEVLVEYRIRFQHELRSRPQDARTEVLKKSLREYFKKAISTPDFVSILAEYDKRVIGTSAMVIWQRPPRYGGLESGKAGYILNLYTLPEARRKGICTRMLTELIKEAKSLGVKYLHLHASEDGEPIYKKAGFIEPEEKELVLTFE
jgi:GNAT superfamily N-acetyltransferase